MMQEKTTTPAQLWVGQPAVVEQAVQEYLQQIFCAEAACGVCSVCKRIAARSYHGVYWLAPEKNQYTKADCEIIAHTSSFMLEEGEQLFFIITAAELLTPAVANSLLKVIEEPPRGYHFIFCTERPRMLLPTILSRCVVSVLGAQERAELVPKFLHFFKEPAHTQLVPFAKFFETAAVTEQMTSLLLDELVLFWRNVAHEGGQRALVAQLMVQQLMDAYQMLPMPGGAKLFWRNLLFKLVTRAEGVSA